MNAIFVRKCVGTSSAEPDHSSIRHLENLSMLIFMKAAPRCNSVSHFCLFKIYGQKVHSTELLPIMIDFFFFFFASGNKPPLVWCFCL